MRRCQYKKGGSKKYVLTANYTDRIKVKPKKDIFLPYGVLLKNGVMFIKEGYEWDGPSGPTFDTEDFMDGSLIHDFLYQLLREKHLKPRWLYRHYADNELWRQLKKDKMNVIRRAYVWLGVRTGGFFSAI